MNFSCRVFEIKKNVSAKNVSNESERKIKMNSCRSPTEKESSRARHSLTKAIESLGAIENIFISIHIKSHYGSELFDIKLDISDSAFVERNFETLNH